MRSTVEDKWPMLAEEGGHGRTEPSVGSSDRKLQKQPRVVLKMYVPEEEQYLCSRTESAVGFSDRKLQKEPRVVLKMYVPEEEQYLCMTERSLADSSHCQPLGSASEEVRVSLAGGALGAEEFIPVSVTDAPTELVGEAGDEATPSSSGTTTVQGSRTESAVGSSDRKLQKQPRVVLTMYVPEEEQYFYCEQCKQFLIRCEKHGLPVFRMGPKVPLGETDRAKKTLPPGFKIKRSGIPNAGLGVFYCGDTELPAGIHFGPFEGVKTDTVEAVESGYTWAIHRKAECYDYIDGQDKTQSNWMRYVNCARNLEEQNLMAYQYRGGVVYRCRRPVARGEELLVWYGDEYAKELGIVFDKLWDNMSSAKGVRSQTQVFSCAGCPYAFTSQDFLHKHMKRSHYDLYCQVSSSATCQKQGDTPSSEQFDKTLPQQGEPKTQPVTQAGKKRCVCNHCGKGFCLLRNLKTHQVTCTGKKLHTCNHCDKSFGQLYNLKRHLLVHSGEKHFICEQCGKGFSQLSDLQRHNQYVHSGEKSFCCEQCDKSFALSSDLKRHQTVHTEVKPFYCLQCNKTFSRLNTLNRHQRLHAKERQFLCQLCDRGFNTMCSLKRHQLLLHTEVRLFRCKTCGKSFNEERDLLKHQRVHTGPKPFPCPLCDKSFCDFKTLNKHQRVHTGEKPFHCDRCDKSFSQRYNFRRHQRLHTEPRKKN